MKYYIVYRINNTVDGYYVGYKNKCENEYNENWIFAKKYKVLGAALTRCGVSYNDYSSVTKIKKITLDLENSQQIKRRKKLSKLDNKEYTPNIEKDINLINILPDNVRIEIVEIEGSDIKNLGSIDNFTLYEYIKKESDKFIKKRKLTEAILIPEKNATEEDINDWCTHMDNVLTHEEND